MVCHEWAVKQGLYASLPIPSQGHFTTAWHLPVSRCQIFATLNTIGINIFILIVFSLVWIDYLEKLPRSRIIRSKNIFASHYILSDDFPKVEHHDVVNNEKEYFNTPLSAVTILFLI